MAAQDEALDAEVERAYAAIRDAFEQWIQITAADTVEAALGHRQLHEQAGGDGSGQAGD
jgi:hypothetical protein